MVGSGPTGVPRTRGTTGRRRDDEVAGRGCWWLPLLAFGAVRGSEPGTDLLAPTRGDACPSRAERV
jgi:hypothetical protein